jgi:hypothetical protein
MNVVDNESAADYTPPPTSFMTPEGHWIVQKFGGTSVGKFALTVVEDIVVYAIYSDTSLYISGLTSLFLIVSSDPVYQNTG